MPVRFAKIKRGFIRNATLRWGQEPIVITALHLASVAISHETKQSGFIKKFTALFETLARLNDSEQIKRQ